MNVDRPIPVISTPVKPVYGLHFLQSFFAAAMQLQLPVAAWKLPGSTQKNLVADLSGKAAEVEADLEELDSGFIVSPFENETNAPLFIQADVSYQSERQEMVVNASLSQEKQQAARSFLHWFGQFDHSKVTPLADYFTGTDHEKETQQSDFEATVQKGIDAIKKGEFQKVVVSRNKMVALPPHFNIVEAFDRLCRLYPAAFVSLISIPGVGTWIGASPELLISIDKDKIFRTVALAGTQPKGDLEDLNEAMWRQKEIEEQAMVGRYIISCFKKIRLREYEEMGPRTVVAAHLMHLRTDFEVDMVDTSFPQLGTVMLNLLHPTSAVCGMPKQSSQQFILAHENYNRSLYSGYLGPVNIDQETHVFVNLRCMQLLREKAILYAGAGITQGSVPAKEWQETELKCKTILAAIS